jgi:CcmD family protein
MPETTDYMIVGYVAVFIILGGFMVYMALRQRTLRAESRELDALTADGEGDSAR